MASAAPRTTFDRLLPDRLLALLCAVMLAVVAVAVVRGSYQWALVPRTVWFHLGTVAIVLALTPVLLLRRKGDRLHRILGWVWAATLFGTALLSLAITPGGGQLFSIISILSVLVIIAVPRLIVHARAHRVAEHRRSVRALVIGALLVAGFFTFPFNRLLGHWLFG